MEGQRIVFGTTGVGSTPHTIPAALNEVLGTNFKLVPGYTGIPQVRMAVEAGEVDGFCQGWTTLVTESRSMLEGVDSLLRPLVVVSDRLPPHPLLRGLPTADELARTQDDKDTMRAVYAPTGISFPFAVGPNVPIDRALALRSAVAKALADPGLIADMQKAGQILEPLSGEEIQDTVEKILSAPRGSLDRIKKILAN
jgi:tripartite-type tricarboxylate transporter receptor subunit TctC